MSICLFESRIPRRSDTTTEYSFGIHLHVIAQVEPLPMRMASPGKKALGGFSNDTSNVSKLVHSLKFGNRLGNE